MRPLVSLIGAGNRLRSIESASGSRSFGGNDWKTQRKIGLEANARFSQASH